MTVTCLPKYLDGAPQIENEEHNRPVMHFLQATENDEEDKIPSNHLVKEQIVHLKCIITASVTFHLAMKSSLHIIQTDK